MTARPPSSASAVVVSFPRQYRQLPPDAFTRRGRRVDIEPDGNGRWMVLEQTDDSAGVLMCGVPKATAVFAGVEFALRHNASLILHMYDIDCMPSAPRAGRDR